jgi:hypothetical protein
MNIGFNTEVSVSAQTYHVQTEVHGPVHPLIETVVYLQGRVLHRRSQTYADLAQVPGFTEESLRSRVEDQHRAVIEELRAGGFEAATQDSKSASPPPPGIQVQLLNPASWASAGTATLDVEVSALPAREPLAGVDVEVTLGGSHGPFRFAGKSDERGRARISFPMLVLGSAGSELVIRAATGAARDEIRYSLRARSRTPAA